MNELRYGSQVRPFLGSMKLPPTTKLTLKQIWRATSGAPIAKWCWRAPSPMRGTVSRMELSAMDCSSGKTVARVRNAVANRDELIRQFIVAEAQLRQKLGEPKDSLARQSAEDLVRRQDIEIWGLPKPYRRATVRASSRTGSEVPRKFIANSRISRISSSALVCFQLLTKGDAIAFGVQQSRLPC